jgi:hypothetical protein
MDYDLILVVGLVITGLAIISLFKALVDERPPIAAGIGLITGIGMAALALAYGGHGLNPTNLPDIIFTVIGRYIS